MLAQIGHLNLFIALIACLMISISTIALKTKSKIQKIYAYIKILNLAQFITLSTAIIILAILFINDDFSTIAVYQNSHTLQPTIYKITALWGNHEGSLLLWCWVLGLFAIAQQYLNQNVTTDLKVKIIITQNLILLAFLILLIYTSNPYAKILPHPHEGQSLNPLLQDPGLIMHPPLLYIGYVGLSANFAIAIAALWQGELTQQTIAYMRKFAMLAWCFLTAGIAMGSWWAYYELGWGGFWFWDPVENASFIPWLVTTALIHSLIVSHKTGGLKQWSLLLSLTAFALSLLGTFLVRSGILTSVHSFASDPKRGLFILLLLGSVLIVAFLLFALRGHKIAHKDKELFHPISREGGLLLNNFLLTACAAVVLIGTLFPLFVELFSGNKISVGPPYFNISFVPLMLGAMGLMAIIPLLAWKRGYLTKAFKSLLLAFSLGLFCIFALLFYEVAFSAILAIGFGVWLMGASLTSFYRRRYKSNVAMPLRFLGMVLAHFAMAVVLLGVSGVSLLNQDNVYIVQDGDTIDFRGYQVEFSAPHLSREHNYLSLESELLFISSTASFYLHPQRRLYAGSLSTTTEAAIRTSFFGDYYATFSEHVSAGDTRFGSADKFILHLYYKPLAIFLWLGSILLVFGGFLCLVSFFRKS